ncbi:hypothetical protein, partial [Streptomyces sp. NPDC005953]|uniref:hypothetical protein n=1 Tax=Streptomyces sp. NPDC005953 TaxID=3156719 RepID=UPI0033C0A426
LPPELARIAVRDRELDAGRDGQHGYVPPRVTLEFTADLPDGDTIGIATLYTDGALPIPTEGQHILVHDYPVRVVSVRTTYTLDEDPNPHRGRAVVFTIVHVVP